MAILPTLPKLRASPWDKLDDKGVVRVGESVRRGDVVLAKSMRGQPGSAAPHVDRSERYDEDAGVVHAVTAVYASGVFIYTIVVRTTRIPVVVSCCRAERDWKEAFQRQKLTIWFPNKG